MRSKDQAFSRFLEWKAMAEKQTGCKLKCLRSDNGGEYCSAEFEQYLKAEGIIHQKQIQARSQQNRMGWQRG